ncbi:hypothetical protein THAOC_05409 [Thalassiosira oceanica]|uniref:Uncharacterized protein n=1 Tax=Thalassiosira oceanica TaxID=159749 RepID=K0T7A9_THAOC|nr:hypothetical protein THAOC_05409 [Thalassiosira oceanica]|eukprot:EJK72999.1 hypothetical protein THAOC_05409 [Thalassiosira oceanica]
MKCTAAAVVGIVATATLVASVCVSLFLARLPALLDRALLLDDGFCTRLAEYDKGNSTGKIIRVDYVEKDRHRVALGAEAASPGRGTQRSHYDGLTGLTKRVRDSALGLTRCISGGRSIRTVRSMIRRLAPSSAKKGPCTRTSIWVKDLALRSLDEVKFVEDDRGVTRVEAVSANDLLGALPPAINVGTFLLSWSSWEFPVVSAHLHGVSASVVLQDGLSFPFPFPDDNKKQRIEDEIALVGDMPVWDFIRLLPKPPNREGLYPRIGTINITNASLAIYQRKTQANQSLNQSLDLLDLLLEINVPDKIFSPVLNLTETHRNQGIDQMHFQRMLEDAFSDSFKRHVVREALSAFKNIENKANKVQEQLQHFAIQTQEAFVDNWIESVLAAWHDTQANVWNGILNASAPFVKSLEDFADDVRTIVSEPLPPLTIVVAHHWSRIINGLTKYGMKIDATLLENVNEFVATKLNAVDGPNTQNGKLSELKRFLEKTGDGMNELAKSCEDEIKDIWLQWHKQFFPEI